jgi:AcrR family transcriptional regulator
MTARTWFDAAARLLISEGPTALTIERLCVAAGVTKGSFYHHFRNRSEFQARFVVELLRR